MHFILLNVSVTKDWEIQNMSIITLNKQHATFYKFFNRVDDDLLLYLVPYKLALYVLKR